MSAATLPSVAHLSHHFSSLSTKDTDSSAQAWASGLASGSVDLPTLRLDCASVANGLGDGGGGGGGSGHGAGAGHVVTGRDDGLPLVSAAEGGDLPPPVSSFLGLASEEGLGALLPHATTTIARTVQTACVRCGIHSLADPRWDATTTLICDMGSRAWDAADLDHGG